MVLAARSGLWTDPASTDTIEPASPSLDEPDRAGLDDLRASKVDRGGRSKGPTDRLDTIVASRSTQPRPTHPRRARSSPPRRASTSLTEPASTTFERPTRLDRPSFSFDELRASDEAGSTQLQLRRGSIDPASTSFDEARSKRPSRLARLRCLDLDGLSDGPRCWKAFSLSTMSSSFMP